MCHLPSRRFRPVLGNNVSDKEVHLSRNTEITTFTANQYGWRTASYTRTLGVIHTSQMIEIIKKEDWQYLFFKYDGAFYLLTPIAISAVSIQYLIKLNDSELKDYERQKEDFLNSLSRQIQYSHQNYSDRNIYNASENIISELHRADGLANMLL
ncbi:MAG TPA: hypothetical protein PKL31_10065 [Fulvivirga sp.]|nr:hypothetical protein [Fulvivirga sp.]